MSEQFYQQAKTKDFRLVESEVESQEAELVTCDDRFARQAEALVLPRRDVASYACSHNFGSAGSPGNTETVSPWRMLWELRGRQLFNSLYFFAGTLACFQVGGSSEFLKGPTTALASFFGFLAVGATVYFILRRNPSDSDEVFSPRSQKNIRRFALAAPLVAIIFAVWNNLGWVVDGLGATCKLPGQPQPEGREQFQANTRSIRDLAANVSPLNTVLLKHLSDRAFEQEAYDQSLALKDRYIALMPWYDHVKISRLLSLSRLPDRQSAYESTAAQYKNSFAGDGYLWNVLADVAVYKKDWPTALEMANKHVQIHDKESVAFEQRANILKELGQTVEAEADQARAKTFQ